MARPRVLVAWLAITAAVLLPGCVDSLGEAAAGCGDEGSCSAGEICLAAEGRCCRPLTCSTLACDATDDGCGRRIECPCPEGTVCNAGECTCVPKSSCIKDQHYTCGYFNACGEDLTCGCDPGYECEEEGGPCSFTCVGRCGQHVDEEGNGSSCNLCADDEWCTTARAPPVPPEEVGVFPPGFCFPCDCSDGACGPRPPGQCDGAPECACTAPQSCGGGGVANRCGCITRTEEELCAGRVCGEFANCGEAVSCGSCDPSQECSPLGRCEADPRPYCWDTPVPWVGLAPPAGQGVHAVVPLREPDGLWAYVTFGDGTLSRIGRFPLAEDGITPRGPFEPLDLLLVERQRYAGSPAVRDDGLELVFATELHDPPGGTHAFVSTRPSTSDPWGAATELSLPLAGYFGSFVLLDDHRTLLVGQAQTDWGQAVILRRPGTEPGSGPFERAGTLQLDDLSDGVQHEVGGITLGCRRDAILNGWIDGDHENVGVVEFLSLDPLTVGPPRLVDIGPFPPVRPGHFYSGAESPGCEVLYLRRFEGYFHSSRTPCP